MPRAPDLTGHVLDDRYELQALIGEGTFGRVYRGYDRRLARLVAVKVIKPWWAEDPEWAGRFEREAQLLARLNDRRIVQVYDIAESPAGLYYVAELVDGESLADRLSRGPFAPPDAAIVAEQLCLALARAHEQRIVHRDVKPANILLTADGAVKVGDFGVARLTEGGSPGAAATAIGTPRYMAPEQARGEHATAASDVYGAGVVLYEMLAGRTPFAGESHVQVALAHLQETVPPLPPHVPVELGRIVRRALKKDPADRYRDSGEMAQALKQSELATLPTSIATPLLPAQHAAPPVPAAIAPAAPPSPTLLAEQPVSGTRRSRRGPALIVLLFLAAAALGLLFNGTSSQTAVPELGGLPRGGVQARVQRAHLKVAFDQRYASAPSGTAIIQRPQHGTRVAEGSTIAVTLSGGPEPVNVPSLVGRSERDALAALHAAGLLSRIIPTTAGSAKPFTVLSQLPAAPARSLPGATVVLHVAEPPRLHTVTSFSGARSVQFRIRGERWRVDYRMSYASSCSLVVICFGPSARVTSLADAQTVASFDLSPGSGSHALSAPPGLYRVSVTQGRDAARWSFTVHDFY